MKEILNAVYELNDTLQELQDAAETERDRLTQSYKKELNRYCELVEQKLHQDYCTQKALLLTEFEKTEQELLLAQDAEIMLYKELFEEKKEILAETIFHYVCHTSS